VTFANHGDPRTVARFSVPGRYVLALEASDGALQSTDTVVVFIAG
jgi:hypothetical protein